MRRKKVVARQGRLIEVWIDMGSGAGVLRPQSMPILDKQGSYSGYRTPRRRHAR